SGSPAGAGENCQTRSSAASSPSGKAIGAWSGSSQLAPTSSLTATLGPKCSLVTPASSGTGWRRVSMPTAYTPVILWCGPVSSQLARPSRLVARNSPFRVPIASSTVSLIMTLRSVARVTHRTPAHRQFRDPLLAPADVGPARRQRGSIAGPRDRPAADGPTARGPGAEPGNRARRDESAGSAETGPRRGQHEPGSTKEADAALPKAPHPPVELG